MIDLETAMWRRDGLGVRQEVIGLGRMSGKSQPIGTKYRGRVGGTDMMIDTGIDMIDQEVIIPQKVRAGTIIIKVNGNGI